MPSENLLLNSTSICQIYSVQPNFMARNTIMWSWKYNFDVKATQLDELLKWLIFSVFIAAHFSHKLPLFGTFVLQLTSAITGCNAQKLMLIKPRPPLYVKHLLMPGNLDNVG